MKAALLAESKKPLIIADIELPNQLEFGQVLVIFTTAVYVVHKLMR